MRSILIKKKKKKKNLLYFGLRYVKISPKQINEQQVSAPLSDEELCSRGTIFIG